MLFVMLQASSSSVEVNMKLRRSTSMLARVSKSVIRQVCNYIHWKPVAFFIALDLDSLNKNAIVIY